MTKHRIVREITYEGTEEQLRKQMANSLKDDSFPLLTTITVRTIESTIPGLTGSRPMWRLSDLEDSTNAED